MSKLILARHGRTAYKEADASTGLNDVGLTESGAREATTVGLFLGKTVINAAYYSMQRSTREALCGILAVHGSKHIDIEAHAALNDYAISGSQHETLDEHIEGGTAAYDVRERIVPFHRTIVTPRLLADQNVLIVASENPLRAYVQEVEGISAADAGSIEFGTAEVRMYDLDAELAIADHVIHRIDDAR